MVLHLVVPMQNQNISYGSVANFFVSGWQRICKRCQLVVEGLVA